MLTKVWTIAVVMILEVSGGKKVTFTSEDDCLDEIRKGNVECLGHKKPTLVVQSRSPASCGAKKTFSANIAGGEDTAPGDWPWMARLIYPRTDFYCSGTLVSDRHVVTAAHCVETTPDFVRLGDSDLTRDYDCLEPGTCPGQGSCSQAEECAPKFVDIRIQNYTNHDGFKMCEDGSCFPKFDIALLTLETSVPLSDFIQPLCLPEPGSIQEETNLVVTGWGNTEQEFGVFKPADILQKLDVKSVPGHQCQLRWRQDAGMDDDLLVSHLCAIGNQAGQSTCRGDSGGPLARLADMDKDVWELVGVVSFGVSRCGSVDLPLGFTRIAGEVNLWLRNLLGSDIPQRP